MVIRVEQGDTKHNARRRRCSIRSRSEGGGLVVSVMGLSVRMVSSRLDSGVVVTTLAVLVDAVEEEVAR
jgi:hypothetical protein